MRAGLLIGAVCVAVSAALVVPAAAQDVPAAVDDPAFPQADAVDPPGPPLTQEEADALGNALNTATADLSEAKPAKPLRWRSLYAPDKVDISQVKDNGSGSMSLNRSLPGDWSAKVGADLTLPPAPDGMYRPDKPLPVIGGDRDSGAAWASVGVTNLASVDARLDPVNDQSKLGTTFKHSIPLGSAYSMTLQDTYWMTQLMGTPAATPSVIPLMAAPPGGTPAALQTWDNQKIIKFDVLGTGTSLGAGITTASTDPIAHNTFSAEQKIYGPLHVTTAVTDFGRTGASKSINAGLRLSW